MVAMFDYHKVILEPSRTGTTIDPTINPRETSCPFLVRDVNPGFEKKTRVKNGGGTNFIGNQFIILQGTSPMNGQGLVSGLDITINHQEMGMVNMSRNSGQHHFSWLNSDNSPENRRNVGPKRGMIPPLTIIPAMEGPVRPH